MLRHSNRREFLCGAVCSGAVTISAGTTAARASDKPHLPNLIHIKPLHFVDFITSVGAGKTTWKPTARRNAFYSVAQTLFSNRDLLLEIRLGIDDVCQPCEAHDRTKGICTATIDTSYRPKAPSLMREWDFLIDTRWCQRLKITPGQKLTARQLCERLRDRAGDITDIYREIPADRTAKRASNLKKGIEKFLLVEICGHHVFNVIWAYGMEKDHLGDESNNFTKVFRQVMDNPSVEVKVLIGVDDICRPCKYNVDGRCQAYDGTIPDRKAIGKLGLRAGEVRKWNDLVRLVAERVQSEEDFLEIFNQGTLEARFSYFKKGIEKLSNRVAEDRR